VGKEKNYPFENDRESSLRQSTFLIGELLYTQERSGPGEFENRKELSFFTKKGSHTRPFSKVGG